MAKENKKEITYVLLTFWVAIISYCLLTKIWNMDLSIPLSYSGDISGLLINIKSVLRSENWWEFDALGAPYGTNVWRQMLDGYIPCALIFTIAKVTDSVGYGINLYYILTFGLSAVCAYYMLRKCDIKHEHAMVGAVIYALIPGHIQRGESHILVGSCFAIPLIISTGIDILHGNACKEEYSKIEKLRFKDLMRSNSREQIKGLFFLAVVSLCTIYYGIFSLMYLTFCVFICLVNTKKVRNIFYYIEYVIVELVCVTLTYLPKVLADNLDPIMEDVSVVTRYLSDTERYAGKLIQYVMPVSGHRIPAFASVRAIYDSSFPLVNENSTSSLGLVMSAGFIIALFTCFTCKSKFLKKIEIYGKIQLFLFALSTMGGLGAFVGMINYNIRCYNRISYFIGAVGIVTFMRAIQEIIEKTELLKRNKIVRGILLMTILLVALFDQTTVGMAYTEEYGSEIKNQYYSDEKFVAEIERREGDDADILVFPVMNAQESAMALTRDGHGTNYNEQMLFIQSRTSDWSTNGKAGEKGERWRNWVEQFNVEQQIVIAAKAGFEGIALYRGGFEEDNLSEVTQTLDRVLDGPDVIHESGMWSYYSIKENRKEILSQYDADELQQTWEDYVNVYGKK